MALKKSPRRAAAWARLHVPALRRGAERLSDTIGCAGRPRCGGPVRAGADCGRLQATLHKMRETEPESTGGGICACGTEEGVEAVDFAYAYECTKWVRGGGSFGLEWHEVAESHVAEVIEL